jgi:hypothetical protein
MADGGGGLEAGGEVHGLADDGVLEASARADVALDERAGGDADADLQRASAALGDAVVDVGERALHLEAAAEGGVGQGGELLAAVGGDEDDHDAVADAFVEDAAVVEDDGVDLLEVEVELADDLFGADLVAAAREVLDVGEQDGALGLAAAETSSSSGLMRIAARRWGGR